MLISEPEIIRNSWKARVFSKKDIEGEVTRQLLNRFNEECQTNCAVRTFNANSSWISKIQLEYSGTWI